MSEIKQHTLQQSNVDALKKQKERITTQIKNERDKQKKQSAIAKIANANQTLAKLRNS
jgi:hypothetical protein